MEFTRFAVLFQSYAASEYAMETRKQITMQFDEFSVVFVFFRFQLILISLTSTDTASLVRYSRN